jgi:hypothetical protein
MEGTSGRSHHISDSVAALLAALVLAGLVAGCGTDRPSAQHRGPGPWAPANATDAPARVTSAVGPGPHSGLPRATPAPSPVRYFACRDAQEAPNCTPVAATGAGAPAGATHGCATIGTYQSCIPVTEAGWERARGDPRNGLRTGPTFVCRVAF